MDNPSNIGKICSQCSRDRLDSWQEHHKEVHIKTGDYVKIRVQFTDNQQEWMWVEVFKISAAETGERIDGLFRNDAVFGTHPRYGDVANFFRSDIADYCEQGDFDNGWKPWHNPTDEHKDHHLHNIN